VRRSGLRMRMAVSYVLVTAAAVILVDGVVLGVLLPGMLASSSHAGQAATVAQQAHTDAKRLSADVSMMAAKSPAGTAGMQLLRLLAASPEAAGLGLVVPGSPAAGSDHGCLSARTAEALILPDGTVVASTTPSACPPGTRLSFAALDGMAGQGVDKSSRGAVVWAVGPIFESPSGLPSATPSPSQQPVTPTPAQPIGPPASKAGHPATPTPTASSPARQTAAAKQAPGQILAGLYVEAPATGGGVSFAQLRPLLFTGGLVLALVIPVGTVFGLLSTRRVIRRIKRLADVTTAVAAGDFQPRVHVSGGDEIGRLEDAFNRMTGRLSTAVDQERRHAGADARQAERARIARELHDSISQDLFSLSLLAAGLGKALRGDSALRPEVAAMERTAAQAMREMHALLLELRPVALEDAGLGPALAELCQAYQTRLAIRIDAELGEVSLDPPAEHAVLRVVQEALGNAARHGDPETIVVRLAQLNGTVTVEVSDDGRGFDPQDVAQRHGMGLALMRERVTELGGEFQLDAAPGEGASIVVRLPGRPGGRP
jgi:signal transduction histidine kinase